MGRHKDTGLDPRYASPIRIKVETRYGRVGVLALGAVAYASAAACGAVLALTVYAFADAAGQLPETRETQLHIVPAPVTEPTPPSAPPPVKVDKVKLIIMQNPYCWIGIPGATCDDGTRTFLGE